MLSLAMTVPYTWIGKPTSDVLIFTENIFIPAQIRNGFWPGLLTLSVYLIAGIGTAAKELR
jgi:hypothetical protein